MKRIPGPEEHASRFPIDLRTAWLRAAARSAAANETHTDRGLAR
jgi:hypothetical protein